jgi:hypothetical protein
MLQASVYQISAVIDLMSARSIESLIEKDLAEHAEVAVKPLVLAAAMRVPGTDLSFADMYAGALMATANLTGASIASPNLQGVLLAALHDELFSFGVVGNEEDAAELCGSMANAIKQATNHIARCPWERNAYIELKNLLGGLYYTSDTTFVLWGRNLQVLTGSIRGDTQQLRVFEPFVSFVGCWWHEDNDNAHRHTIFETCSHTCQCTPTQHMKEYLNIQHLSEGQLHAFLVLASVRFDIEAFCRVMVLLHHHLPSFTIDELDLLSHVHAINSQKQ